VFERFTRFDPHRTRKEGGFGLGLAIVKAITEAHHGSARVRSTVGRGSVFELLLPVQLAALDREVAVTPTSHSLVGTQKPASSEPP
jgi:signal transduction histidine kinase